MVDDAGAKGFEASGGDAVAAVAAAAAAGGGGGVDVADAEDVDEIAGHTQSDERVTCGVWRVTCGVWRVMCEVWQHLSK